MNSQQYYQDDLQEQTYSSEGGIIKKDSHNAVVRLDLAPLIIFSFAKNDICIPRAPVLEISANRAQTFYRHCIVL